MLRQLASPQSVITVFKFPLGPSHRCGNRDLGHLVFQPRLPQQEKQWWNRSQKESTIAQLILWDDNMLDFGGWPVLRAYSWRNHSCAVGISQERLWLRGDTFQNSDIIQMLHPSKGVTDRIHRSKEDKNKMFRKMLPFWKLEKQEVFILWHLQISGR